MLRGGRLNAWYTKTDDVATMMPFIPDTLPLASLDWTKFIRLIGQANAELARYDAMLQAIVNPQVLLSPLTTQEAVLSSKIEGTQTSLEEVLQFDASQEVAPERQSDIHEVVNYRRAMREASGRRPAIVMFHELITLAEGR